MRAKIVGLQMSHKDELTLDLSFDSDEERLIFLTGIIAAKMTLELGAAPTAPVTIAAGKKTKAVTVPEAKKPDAPAPEVATTPATPREEALLDQVAHVPELVDTVPAALTGATSFKAVMEWMLANGHVETADATALCEKWRDQIPVVKRLGGDLKERVGRAFEVLKAK